MVGGVDVHIPSRVGSFSIEVAVRAGRQKWPKAVFENGSNADRYDDFRQIPFGTLDELFVYRDSDAANAWDAEGAIPEVYNQMIHLLSDPAWLTIVIDSSDAEMNELIAAITSGLEDQASSLPTFSEAASVPCHCLPWKTQFVNRAKVR